MIKGLVKLSVFVNVIDNELLVAFLSVQKFPPFAVEVEDGSVTALNPPLVR